MRATACIVLILVTIALVYAHMARLQSAKYRHLALIVEKRGLPDLVLKASLKGLAWNPFNINLHGYAARAQMQKKDYRKALYHLKIMLRYYPNDLNALINSAWANYYTGNFKEALKMQERVKSINPSYVKG
jgi:tetratricopeptide (TPR) repeat protein